MTDYEKAFSIAEQIRDQGYEVFFVGGCVRDKVLGLQPKDYDLVTSMPLAEILRVFYKSVTAGNIFGVAIVDGVEVATYRKEEGSKDGRHPEKISFGVSLEEDLARRDFTINAMAENPFTGELIDPFGGVRDLQAKTVRTVGDASKRLREDYLRMLRAIRFASRFDFDLDPSLTDSIIKFADKINQLPSERIGAEVLALLNTKGMSLLEKTTLDRQIFGITLKDGDTMFANLEKFENVDLTTRLAFLMIRIKEDKRLEKMTQLRVPGKLISDVLKTLDLLQVLYSLRSQSSIVKFLREPLSKGVRQIEAAIFGATELIFAEQEILLDSLIKANTLVKGDDLIKLGFDPKMLKEKFGSILREAELAQFAGELTEENKDTWILANFTRLLQTNMSPVKTSQNQD